MDKEWRGSMGIGEEGVSKRSNEEEEAQGIVSLEKDIEGSIVDGGHKAQRNIYVARVQQQFEILLNYGIKMRVGMGL